MLKNKIYFITAIGTDIGKTYLVENLLHNIVNSRAIKPIISGFNFGDVNSDCAKILRAQNEEFTSKNVEKITPWRFEEPLSPHFAAEKEGKKIDFDEVVEFCKEKMDLAKQDDVSLFIEGAGGIMSPISYEKTFLDLVKILEVDVLLVGANYLGAISHILSACNALKGQRSVVEKIIINEGAPKFVLEKNDVIKTIETFTKVDTLLMEEFIDQLK